MLIYDALVVAVASFAPSKPKLLWVVRPCLWLQLKSEGFAVGIVMIPRLLPALLVQIGNSCSGLVTLIGGD